MSELSELLEKREKLHEELSQLNWDITIAAGVELNYAGILANYFL